MQFYLLKRKFSGSYYTSRVGEANKPAVLAFTKYEKAKFMKDSIVAMEYQPQPIVIEKTNKAFIDKIIFDSRLPVIVFREDGDYLEMSSSIDNITTFNSRRVLEDMYIF